MGMGVVWCGEDWRRALSVRVGSADGIMRVRATVMENQCTHAPARANAPVRLGGLEWGWGVCVCVCQGPSMRASG